ncbi:MAG: hypothetical protein KDE46_10035, partial [Caldilineaceae bacterium]|nr:hypothetical protein [Caldilineaceae bacterium]
MTDNFASRDTIIHGDQVGGDKFSGDKVMGDKYEPHYHYYAETPAVNAGRQPMMALAPPSDYVQRSEEFDRLIDYLLAGKEPTVAITATIRGAGGFGKTTLAQAICQDARIRAVFPDGILWTTVGDEKANVLLGLRKLYQTLTGREARFVDEHDAAAQLSGVLAERRCLIVIDDVWNAAHLMPFLEGGAHCARLVTTRIASVVPKEAEMVSLDAMRISEAAELLGAGLANPDLAALSALAQRLGEWPLLLKLVNRRLYQDVEQYSLPLADAMASVDAELDAFGLTSFDVEDAEERQQAVAASMGVGLQRLKSDARYGPMPVDEVARFMELAIFPEDTPIPLPTLALLWGQTGGLSEMAAERLCRRLADLALILRYDGQAQTILLHDVTRHYLMSQASPEQLIAWHNALLDGYRALCEGEWWRLPDDGYVYQNLLWHLHAAQQPDALEKLLVTYSWLDAKLQATNIVSLIRDFDWRRDKQRHSQLGLLQHALQMSVSVLAQDNDQLVSQLYGRLLDFDAQWEPFVDEMATQQRASWLQSKSPDLRRPGGNLLYTLSGHTDGVDNLLLTDGRLISSCSGSISRDTNVKVWDLAQGALLHSLEGHTAGVSNLLLTTDGRLISSCSSSIDHDTSVKVWDIEQGDLLHSLEGHTAGVSNLLLTTDGRLISSCRNSRDSSVKVWDVEQGVLLHSLEEHTAGVSNLLLTEDGKLIS